MNGWIKLHRKLLDNPIVCKDADHLAIWMYLLLNATHSELSVMFEGKRILLQPGQLITGRKSLSLKFNISESKVQRILKCFENEHQIEQQTSNKNRLISILNWCSYQSSEQQIEQQVNNNRTTTEQQLNTNKNVINKEIQEKEDEDGADHVQVIEQRFIQRRGKGLFLANDDILHIKAILEMAIPLDFILDTIDACFNDYTPKHRYDSISKFEYCAKRIAGDWEKKNRVVEIKSWNNKKESDVLLDKLLRGEMS